ncbi:NucA/NucB deoxyribonuclease domain-containing protein [Saccharothrix sp. NRRL B-16348]|uniref:NucA/NucB deoxyribonuclease domain-containing protein n=1 Tax=Saccharothrix sp. NRRL B-16348 TaxID=1415542 RepID=UPI0012F9BCCD|nr:NucA/NucB deoxyribonuclease domain-containing protein [Saccharothrix sp. NRRL B-16348]
MKHGTVSVLATLVVSATISVFPASAAPSSEQSFETVDLTTVKAELANHRDVDRFSQPVRAQAVAPGTRRAKDASDNCDAVRVGQSALGPDGQLKLCVQSTPITPEAERAARERRSMTTQAVQPLPSWCYEHVDGSWWITRTQGCQISPFTVTIVRIVNGVYVWVGEMKMNRYEYVYTSATLNTYGHQVEFGTWAQSGDTAGVTVSGYNICSEGCTVLNSSFPAQSPIGRIAQGEAYINGDATARGSVAYTDTSWYFTFAKPGAVPGVADGGGSFPWTRCDHALPGPSVAGCVMGDFTPTMSYSLSGSYPELATHIRDAQAAGLPGGLASNRPLNRLTDPTLVDKNRAVACPASLPRPPGQSCDEYPMASTHQGAATGVNGYSWRMINENQNSSGGVALNDFFRAQRIIEWDGFWMVITP